MERRLWSSGLRATSGSGARLGPTVWSTCSSQTRPTFLLRGGTRRGIGRNRAVLVAERDGADAELTMSSDVVAVDGGTAVVRVFVEYGAARNGRGVTSGCFDLPGTLGVLVCGGPFAPGRPERHQPSLAHSRTAHPRPAFGLEPGRAGGRSRSSRNRQAAAESFQRRGGGGATRGAGQFSPSRWSPHPVRVAPWAG
jgi:hypothetical protein